MPHSRILLLILPLIAISTFWYAPAGFADAAEVNGGITAPKWTVDLSAYSRTCNNGTKDCQESSPALADVNGDGYPDVVVATNKGYVVAVGHNGVILWAVDTAAAFGMNAGTQNIQSSPAVADIDGDGWPEIVVGAGRPPDDCPAPHRGGVIVLTHNGAVRPGWPRFSVDPNSGNCHDTVVSTPALGNLDNDPDLEIIAGSFDRRVYAWNPDGSLLPGFPPSSYHLSRFPDWPNLVGRLADTIWSSPALADVNRDGQLDIFIGSDEGNYDNRFGGDAHGWTCPYAPPPGGTAGYCGGSLYGLTNTGALLPGFPRYLLEIVQSTPAIADVTGDGFPEVFAATGTYYYNNSPDHPTAGFILNGWNHQGNVLPGWPVVLGGAAPSSPAIGNIAGDARPEIIIPAFDSRIYAFFSSGQPVPGFPMTPRREKGQTGTQFADSVVLGDYDGDGLMEIFLNNSWTITVVDGNGQQLTGDNFPHNALPIFYTSGSLLNDPAVGDLDGDGRLELVAQNSKLIVYDLPQASAEADWPMFKQNARRTATPRRPAHMATTPAVIRIFQQVGADAPITSRLSLQNQGDDLLAWQAQPPAAITLSISSGTLSPGDATAVTISPERVFTEGVYTLGALVLTATAGDYPAVGSPTLVPMTLIVGDIHTVYTPLVTR